MEPCLIVCPTHGLTEATPTSERCLACIEESNAEARPYLETAHSLAEGCRTVNKYLRDHQKSDSSIA